MKMRVSYVAMVLCVGAMAAACGKDKKGNDEPVPPVTGVGLVVNDGGARACDVVLTDPDHAVQAVRFADGVQGKALREGPRWSVAFFARADAAIAAGQTTLELTAGAATTNLAVELSHCFDRAGAELAAANVGIQ